MTPKEALRRISGFISFCCYEYFDKELEKDWKKDIDTITQALERLELLEKENQDLKDKLNINFEDCADELCEVLTQRDKLYDENLELQKENQDLKNKNAALKIKVRAWEIQSEKYKKIINILKEKADIRLHILTNTDGSKIYEIEFIFTYYSTIHEITQQEYDLLKEFLE